VIKKEAFPFVEAVERLRHLLLRDEGFRLFTDHRNLICVFDPMLRDNDFKKQAVDKLCRWASKLFAFKYMIEHIPGESNIWADILSRWKGDGEQKILRLTLKVLQWNGVSPLANEEFFWPGLDDIRGEQKVSAEQEEEEFKEDPDKKALVNPEGRLWIPNPKLLRERICIIANCEVNGHQGRTATLRAIEVFFYWDCLEEDVKQFCRMCLHCIGSLDSKAPRSLGAALRTSRRNQVIHYDFLFVNNTRKFS